jgi:uncharacterized protein YodC (DUF2158 family)
MAKKAKYQVGDIVRLRSGGPEMTVQTLAEDRQYNDHYRCQWFAGKKLESGNFQEESLEPVKPETK